MDRVSESLSISVSDSIRRFEYAVVPDARTPAWNGLGNLCMNPSDSPEVFGQKTSTEKERNLNQTPEAEAMLREEKRLSFEAGKQVGHAEGRAQGQRESSEAARTEQKQYMQRAAASLAALVQQQQSYLKAVESEVVALAFAIAARILRHEAQIDPLLLSGAVRVALGQLSNSTKARLFVPVSELEMWKETLAHLPNLPLQPEISGVEIMRVGECTLRTEVGSVDLGLRAQLKEIEKGFFETLSVGGPQGKTSVAPAAGSE